MPTAPTIHCIDIVGHNKVGMFTSMTLSEDDRRCNVLTDIVSVSFTFMLTTSVLCCSRYFCLECFAMRSYNDFLITIVLHGTQTYTKTSQKRCKQLKINVYDSAWVLKLGLT